MDRIDALLAEKAEDYASPEENFERIAAMWQFLFGWEVRSVDVGLAMICVKLSREWFRHKEDNLADIEGYVECIRRIEGGTGA